MSTLLIAPPRPRGRGSAGANPAITGFQAQAGGLVVTDAPTSPLPADGERIELPAPATDITMRYRLEGGADRSQPAPVGRVLVLLPPVTRSDPALGDPAVVVEVIGGTVRNLVCPDLPVSDQLCGRQRGAVWSTTNLPAQPRLRGRPDGPASAGGRVNALVSVVSATGDGQDLFPLFTGVARLLGYLAFVLVIGTTFFLAWLWPKDTVEWVFIRLFYGGAALMVLTTVLVALLSAPGSLGDAFLGRSGATALARLAILALGVGFAWELLGDARRWRIPILIWQLAPHRELHRRLRRVA